MLVNYTVASHLYFLYFFNFLIKSYMNNLDMKAVDDIFNDFRMRKLQGIKPRFFIPYFYTMIYCFHHNESSDHYPTNRCPEDKYTRINYKYVDSLGNNDTRYIIACDDYHYPIIQEIVGEKMQMKQIKLLETIAKKKIKKWKC